MNAPMQWQDVGDAQIAYSKIGAGPALLLLHGYPLTGATFRSMLPALAAHFTCYVLDLPGAGESRWSKQSGFKFGEQALGLKRFVDALGLQAYSILAHDTGGTIGRQLAIIDAARVEKLIAIGTEIPGHRPPWIRLFQFRSHLPGANGNFRKSMASRRFLRSSMGFGGAFTDLGLIDGEFHKLFIAPLVTSAQLTLGQIYRLRGIDWALLDSLAQGHARIKAPVLLIWGEDDPVFPLAEARKMVPQFHDCRGLKVIPGAKLFVHEEFPEAVAKESLTFLLG